MKLKKYILLFFVSAIFVFAGCSIRHYAKSADEIKKGIKLVDYSDGVTVREAIVIAQNHLLENPPPTDNPSQSEVDPYKVLDVYKSRMAYSVHFDFQYKEKKPFLYPFYWAVGVDKNTGRILLSRFAGHK